MVWKHKKRPISCEHCHLSSLNRKPHRRQHWRSSGKDNQVTEAPSSCESILSQAGDRPDRGLGSLVFTQPGMSTTHQGTRGGRGLEVWSLTSCPTVFPVCLYKATLHKQLSFIVPNGPCKEWRYLIALGDTVKCV